MRSQVVTPADPRRTAAVVRNGAVLCLMFLFGLVLGFLLPEWQDLAFRTALIMMFWYTIPVEWKTGASRRLRADTTAMEGRSGYRAPRTAQPRYANRGDAGSTATPPP